MDYRLFISQQALEFLLSLKGNDRKVIRSQLEAIRDFPSSHAHFVGKFAIDYWEDFADRDVKIIAIQPADRAQMS